ncbi:forkhead box protein O-like isoform X2 [Sitophilus oryzae]|uniref:Forkhead box protein O-like isoform X2 n=1 Tax=Sitophilus oryzae TaxID=7048 RepID=A0A6J2XL32_SITOR|nr:forkhead box protein O-like isoform X2 [Sitophilus oryzae]
MKFDAMNVFGIPGAEDLDVILVNSYWNQTNKTQNFIPEMHNVQNEEFSAFPGLLKSSDLMDTRDLVSPSPRGSDSGIESDCADGNLSWLLNYKIQELPPVPDSTSTENLLNTTRMVNVVQQKPINEIVISEGYRAGNQKLIGPKKPPFTYTELIEHALSEKGELTVSGIYNWITEHFPFYKANDDRWKNSVRHNLSINPHFRKGGKAIHGAGHLWTIAQKDEHKTWQMRQRINDFIRISQKNTKPPEEDAFDKELQVATQSILGEIQQTQNIQPETQNTLPTTNQIQQNEDIHVEFINIPESTTGLEDFLSPPVSKQELVNECGLGSDFFITDINPNQLGLSLAEAEVAEEGIYDEMSLEYYGLKE